MEYEVGEFQLGSIGKVDIVLLMVTYLNSVLLKLHLIFLINHKNHTFTKSDSIR